MTPRPPRSTLFPSRRSSDLGPRRARTIARRLSVDPPSEGFVSEAPEPLPEAPPRRRMAINTAIFSAATGLSRVAGLIREVRSEEHTSELSHGYISYAVFCLK